MNPIYMLLAIPFFFLLIGLEYLVGKWKKIEVYSLSDAITNLNIGVGSQVFSVFMKGLILGGYLWVYEHYAFLDIPVTWWSAILCLFAFDFLYYWAHRWSHGVNFLWAAHVVHHSSEEYNLSVALRQSWIHNLLAMYIFLPLPLLGFPPAVAFPVALFVTLYQFWIHTKTISKLPAWVEYFFNTPSHHRVHHGVNHHYIDKNHAATFIIWDRMFGTFEAEEEEPVYGITTPINSLNPVWANYHYFQEMQEASREMKWVDKLKMIVAKPGWRPDYLGGSIPLPEPDEEKYAPPVHHAPMKYVLMQFIAISIGLMVYMYHFDSLSLLYQCLFGGIIVASLLICGGLLEQKSWVVPLEYLRLVLVLGSLNVLYYFQYIDWFNIMLVSSVLVFLVWTVWFFMISAFVAPLPAELRKNV